MTVPLQISNSQSQFSKAEKRDLKNQLLEKIRKTKGYEYEITM